MLFERRSCERNGLAIPQSHAGFTLIEAVIGIAVMTIIALGVVAFQRSVIMNTKVVQSELREEQQVRKALAMFTTDVRSATASAAGAYAIATTSSSTFMFYANVDTDGSIEQIRYFLASSTLRKGVTKPTGTVYNQANEKISVIVNDISNATSSPIFIYYDTGYDGFTSSSTDPLPSPINIPLVRLVKMQLTVNPNGIRSPVMQTYMTQATLRNLKDNL